MNGSRILIAALGSFAFLVLIAVIVWAIVQD
jgi:hypothetical protein